LAPWGFDPGPGWRESLTANGKRPTAEDTMPREKIILECTTCRERNYFQDKNRRLHPERVEQNKYCPRCNKHVTHKESK
jgi:large subunit ribosomal protein L33